MEKTIEESKEEFIKIYNDNIKREGADKLLDYLINSSNFFTSPASGRRHSGRRPCAGCCRRARCRSGSRA